MENHCVFKFSLFLSFIIFAVNYNHIHVHCSFLPPNLPIPFFVCLSAKIHVLCLFVFFNNPLNSDSDAHVCMGMGPSIGAWTSYEWPFVFLPLSAPSSYRYLLRNGWRLKIIYSINASDLAWCAFVGITVMICIEDRVS